MSQAFGPRPAAQLGQASSAPAPEARPRRHWRRNTLLVIGAAMVMVVTFLAVSAVATADRLSASRSAADRVKRDEAAISDSFQKGVGGMNSIGDLTSSANLAQVKSTIQDAKNTIDAAQATVRSDQDQARAADMKVQGRTLFTAIASSRLDKEHRQIQAGIKALDVQLEEAQVLKQQVQIVLDVLDVVSGFSTVGDSLSRNDEVAAVTAYGPTDSAMSKVMAEASAAAETPKEAMKLLDVMQSAVHHLKAVLDAVSSRKATGLRSAQAALQTDVTNLNRVDQKLLQQEYKDLGKTYEDRMNAIMRAAGG